MLIIVLKNELPFWVKFEHDIIIISTCGSTTAVPYFIIIKVITEMRNKNYSSSNADTEDDEEPDANKNHHTHIVDVWAHNFSQALS